MRFLIALFSLSSLLDAAPNQPLQLVATVPLPHVEGRIDHMSIDAKGERLFVAALGNNTIEVIDVKNARLLHTITGLREPQGIAYVPKVNRIYVANRADGTLRIIDGNSYETMKTIGYGDNADNVRYDSLEDRIWVGYGHGALGQIDTEGTKLADISLDAHPESFQLETKTPRIFVNLPASQKIGVVDRAAKKMTGHWTTGGSQANYPMALDEPDHRLFVVSRTPARLIVLDTESGKIIASLPAVGDSDDVFFDASRKRIYATGGEGAISVFQQHDPDRYSEISRISTVKGARTGFFSPDLNRLFVAVRREGGQNAEIRIFEPR